MENKFDIRIRDNFNTGKYDIAITSIDDRNNLSYGAPLTFVIQDETTPLKPVVSLEKEDLQRFFNELWAIGLRPKDGTGNSGHIASMQYHLEDMRKLVFDKLYKREK